MGTKVGTRLGDEASRGNVVRSKTDQRYWADRVERRERGKAARRHVEGDYSVMMQFAGERRRVPLGTANKTTASHTAAAFYRSLLQKGWTGAHDDHPVTKPKRTRIEPVEVDPGPDVVTVGKLLEAYRKVAVPRASTFAAYERAIRKIYGDILAHSRAGRYGPGKKNRSWKQRIDNTPLSAIDGGQIIEWKHREIEEAKTPETRKAKVITVNSVLRNARSLFAKKHRAAISKFLELPEKVAFDDVRLETSPTMRYRSRIDARKIIADADAELKTERPVLYVALNLALRCGLRKREIDTLMWRSVDFERKVLHIESNGFYELKSRDSEGEVDLSDELTDFLKAFREKHLKETFVLPSHRAAKAGYVSSDYRCMETFNELAAWLRGKGVDSKRPIHEMRKEVGSLIADEHGIYAASRFLRHADIRITAAHYLDKKKRIIAPI